MQANKHAFGGFGQAGKVRPRWCALSRWPNTMIIRTSWPRRSVLGTARRDLQCTSHDFGGRHWRSQVQWWLQAPHPFSSNSLSEKGCGFFIIYQSTEHKPFFLCLNSACLLASAFTVNCCESANSTSRVVTVVARHSSGEFHNQKQDQQANNQRGQKRNRS